MAYRGSPAPGGQCLHRRPPPPPRISTPPPCHIDLHGWRLWGSGCAPRLVNPASASEGGGALGENRQAKQQQKRSSARNRKEKKRKKARGPYICYFCCWVYGTAMKSLVICLGLIFFLKFAPTSWAGAPSKACARGPCPPLPPPSARHCVDV